MGKFVAEQFTPSGKLVATGSRLIRNVTKVVHRGGQLHADRRAVSPRAKELRRGLGSIVKVDSKEEAIALSQAVLAAGG
jgi:hypothetical protein